MKVELLAPAGSFEGMKAAVHAGADAVYLGGNLFGARAYADNLDEQQLLLAIDYAHLHGKKLYLTVNTLLKEQELEQDLYHYLHPFYERGLDAVIVQDIGVLNRIREAFPKLPIHVSTQMAVTGVESAKLLQSLGVTRIVTARELSLEEIRAIYDATHMEIECFIHGALCYSYSGMCLFSSILGGRSGNRGRCAQPCRLPYDVYRKEQLLSDKESSYPLSPKDMCTVELLPEILNAGVLSLKIEGRMKKPEYTAGVTEIYRKYVDLCLDQKAGYRVDKSDIQELKDIYNRDGFSRGYYQVRNGKDMIAYRNNKILEKKDKDVEQRRQKLFAQIKTDHMDQKQQEMIEGRLWLRVGQPAKLTLSFHNREISVTGAIAEAAQKQPLSQERVRRQMQKTGSSQFQFSVLKIEMQGELFLNMQSLNELRRNAIETLEQEILTPYVRVEEKNAKITGNYCVRGTEPKSNAALPVAASVETREQLEAVLDLPHLEEIYCSLSLMDRKHFYEETLQWMRKAEQKKKHLSLSLPYIVRGDDLEKYADDFVRLSKEGLTGFLVRNLESFAVLKKYGLQEKAVLDYSVYSFNNRTELFWEQEKVKSQTVPLELNFRELRNRNNAGSEMIVYGYYPMMISAQCIQKTMDTCDHRKNSLKLKDRFGQIFVAKCYCDFCYNVIYNSITFGLLKEQADVKKLGLNRVRISFTVEDGNETRRIAKMFIGVYTRNEELPETIPEFTKGHFKRGVE